MGVSITNYTDSDAIRGAIGLTKSEVTDDMLVDQNLEYALLIDLDSWVDTHSTIYSTGLTTGATAPQIKQKRLLELYSMWFGACRAASMLLAIPEKISDGKSEVKRFNSLDLVGIRNEACGMAESYKLQLQEELGSTVSETGYSLMGSAEPDYDPITNDGA